MKNSQRLVINSTSPAAAAFGAIDEAGRLSEAHLGAKDAGLGSGGQLAAGDVARQSTDLTPKQHVFLTLGNLIKLIGDGWDLEKNRDQLKSSLENAASWEPLLANRSQEPSPGANHGTLSDQEDTDKP